MFGVGPHRYSEPVRARRPWISADVRARPNAMAGNHADHDATPGRVVGGVRPPASPAVIHTRSRPTVLETKLVPSGVRSGHVLRPLAERIVQASARVTILNAPAGYGKTTLLSQCAAAFERRVAWVSLDEADDDPIVLLSEIATAVDRIVPLDQKVFTYLLSPEPPIRTEVLPRLLNSLADSPALALLLDDVHVVRAHSSASILALICEHLPPNMRLVLAAREVPSLPLERLRVGGCLLEMGPDELALTRAEARELLDSVHVSLDPEAFEVVYERTEGWAAGLYLAAVGALEAPDPSRALREFGGDDRNLFDYFSSELLTREPAARRSFLLRTSVLDRFSAPLCDAVLERNDSATVLAELEQSNRFLVPLDHRREWFRYHHLFGEMLRTQLARVEPSNEARLRARASDWHEQRGDVPEAIEHALAACDRARAAGLLAENLRVLFNTGHQTAIQRWLAAFSDADVAECPPLAAGAMWVMGLIGERALTSQYLSNLEHSSFQARCPLARARRGQRLLGSRRASRGKA